MNDQPNSSTTATADSNATPTESRALLTACLPVPYAGLDLETTGLVLEKDRIVELAVVRVEADGRRVEFSTLVNPGIPIPAEATALHGISDEDVADAPTLEQLLPTLRDLLWNLRALAVFNGRRFDVPFLAENLMRMGVTDDPFAGVPVVDARDLDMLLRPRDLKGVHAAWTGKAEMPGAHHAVADVLATLEALGFMLARPELAGLTPAQLADAALPESERGALDPWGWFRRDAQGRVVFGKGKHAGTPVLEIAQGPEASFLDWMVHKAKDMPPPVRRYVTRVMDAVSARKRMAVQQRMAPTRVAERALPPLGEEDAERNVHGPEDAV